MNCRFKDLMKTVFTMAATTLGLVMFGTAFAPLASAQCGYFDGHKPPASIRQLQQSWRRLAEIRPASLLLVSGQGDDSDNMSIVGFWKVRFVSQNSPGIPDGTVVDEGFVTWHNDGTELMNSGRAPVTQSFCMGVWKKIGGSTYKLNHFALSWDPSGTVLIGPTNIREEVTVGHGGSAYAGTFTIDQYDRSGNLLAHLAGAITATRITVDTPVQDVL